MCDLQICAQITTHSWKHHMNPLTMYSMQHNKIFLPLCGLYFYLFDSVFLDSL